MTHSVEQGSAGMKLEEIIAGINCAGPACATNNKFQSRHCQPCCIRKALEAYFAQEKQRRERLEKLVAFYREFIEACKSGEAEPDDEHEHGWFHGRGMLAEDFVKELAALLEG